METKSWYQSTTIIGGIVQLLVFVDLMLKLNIGNELLTNLVNGVFGLVGVVMVIYGRLKTKTVITVGGRSFIPKN